MSQQRKIHDSCPCPEPAGHGVAQLLEALRYKPEGRRFDSLDFFFDINLPALGSTQPVNETSTRNISWGLKAADA